MFYCFSCIFKFTKKWVSPSLLCCNDFRTKTHTGNKIECCGLPKNPETQVEYHKILKITGINQDKGHICSEHWSKGFRDSSGDFPDVVTPYFPILKMEKKGGSS